MDIIIVFGNINLYHFQLIFIIWYFLNRAVKIQHFFLLFYFKGFWRMLLLQWMKVLGRKKKKSQSAKSYSATRKYKTKTPHDTKRSLQHEIRKLKTVSWNQYKLNNWSKSSLPILDFWLLVSTDALQNENYKDLFKFKTFELQNCVNLIVLDTGY